MSKLRAHVYRDRATDRECIAEVYLDVDGPRWLLRCPSWAEAMQAAALMLPTLERLLMDHVHAERTARRVERCGACWDLGNEHNKRAPQCSYYEPPTTTPDIHTMEATA